MRITKTTDYALRVLAELALAEERVNAVEMEEALGISSWYLQQVCAKMRNAGWLDARRGQFGSGYLLIQSADQITVWDVVKVFEKHLPMDQQMEQTCDYNNEFVNARIRDVWSSAQEAMVRELSSVTIADLIK